jgi:DNA-binding beta-propeller fold protein YncE
MALPEIDTTRETPTVDAIRLADGARPQAVVIDPKDNYAYIADQNLPKIYVLDINPNSTTYHTVVQTINVTSPLGLSQLAISSDGRRLFATGSDNTNKHVTATFTLSTLTPPTNLALRVQTRVCGTSRLE